jgi:hypothetical protein
MHGKILEAAVYHEAEDQAEDAKENTEEQEFVAVNSAVQELDLRKIGQFQSRFTTGFFGGLRACGSVGE